ncbi:MAG: hypothetical protein AAGJ80_19245, partial [Cyanobacteria bacterium J06553_1]
MENPEAFPLTEVDIDHEVGYFVLVDTKAVKAELAEATDEYPLNITHMTIKEEKLSPHTRNLLEGTKRVSHVSKLVGHHERQENILYHLKHLRLLMDLGLEVERVKCVYRFKQARYMEDFVRQNIKYRRDEASMHRKSCLKLVNNSLFGKTLYSQLKRNEKARVCTRPRDLLNAVRSPLFKRAIILREDRVLVVSRVAEIQLTHPLQIGFTVLEQSKVAMRTFFNHVLKKTFGDRVKLGYTDTDSLLFSLRTTDLNKDLATSPLKDWIDFSGFPPTHPLFDDTRKGQLGLLKPEVSEEISQYVGLSAKCYSLKFKSGKDKINAKGVSKGQQRKI